MKFDNNIEETETLIEKQNEPIKCEVIDVDRDLIDDIHNYVENFLESFERPLNIEEQYACILIAYDNLVNECKKVCSQENINKVIILHHYGDEIVKMLEEEGLDEKVKEIYMKGIE